MSTKMMRVLLERARREGCACYKILDTQCLVHYAYSKQQGQEAYEILKKKLEIQDAQSDRRTTPADSPSGGSGRQRTDPDLRRGGRSDRDRPAKPVHEGSVRKW